MRPIYGFLKIVLPYALRVMYRRTKTVDQQNKWKVRTIFVSNHPSAFIDPLNVASFQPPVVHFMTRSDVFKPWLKPITWSSHMVPIYRMAEDGSDSADKNADVFKDVQDVLIQGRSLILFGEGYTDDVFIRSLKPIKKGPARIGFQTMEATNWELDIKVQAVGINYTDPGKFRSDVLIANGKLISLLDYKDLYKENPNKAMTQLTREIQGEMRRVITCVNEKELAPFVEQIMCITRKGMNAYHYDSKYSLEERYRYSKALADQVNASFDNSDARWTSLREKLNQYFKDQKKEKINENWVHTFARTGGRSMALRVLYLLFVWPVFLLGLVHGLIPYLSVKYLVEKSFRRKVFWSGVKGILGSAVATLYNLPVIWLFYAYIYPSYWLGILYFLTIPALSGIIAYNYFQKFRDLFRQLKISKDRLKHFAERRRVLEDEIKALEL